MNRREALQQLALVAGGSLIGKVAQAAVSGKIAATPAANSALSADQKRMVITLAELIIPRTDTPGAIEAGVPDFIDQIVTSWYTPTERKIFLDGLMTLDGFCKAKFGKPFNACNSMQQTESLADADVKTRTYRARPGDGVFVFADEKSPFFYKIKQLTVLGYYTSEVGGTQELSYNPVPHTYDGDYDFGKVGRQWST